MSRASIFTSHELEVGTCVRVRIEQYNVSIISIVCGKRLGQDNILRVNVEFVNRLLPLEGIE